MLYLKIKGGLSVINYMNPQRYKNGDTIERFEI